MKTTRHLFLTFVACSMILLSACSDENGPQTPNGRVPDKVVEAFYSQYPDASDVNWELNDEYAVASFNIKETRSTASGQNKAWYRLSDASWSMSDIDIPYNLLPQAVKTSFEESEYAKSPWKLDDDEVDVIYRHGYDEIIYVIEVEKRENGKETEADLYYSADGILVNTVIDGDRHDHSDMLPGSRPSTVTEWINQNYPGARIVEIDDEDGGIEIDFIYEGMKHEALFTIGQEWIYTKSEYERRHISLIETVVMDALRASEHYTDDRNIDDIDRYKTATGEDFYCFELETRFDDDIEVYISATGEVLSGRPSFGNSGGAAVNNTIEQFIAEKYPGAIILEKDNDDGYIEVEIRHDGIEKEVIFNGRHEWIRTKWEISRHRLPEAIINAIVAAGYSASQIDDDDIDVIETADKLVYEVELENRGDDIKLIIVNGVVERVVRD